MKKFTLAHLAAAFAFGFSTADVDAKEHHHKWHLYKSQHNIRYHMRHHKHHQKYHHKKHHIALLPVVVAHVYVSSQRLSLDVNGSRYADWAVSTARQGYHTPEGSFHATRLERVYYSRKYDNSPMPYSVFFYSGNAIHGTNHVGALGRPASHGCIRLLPQNAAQLFAMVQHYGMARTRIIISD